MFQVFLIKKKGSENRNTNIRPEKSLICLHYYWLYYTQHKLWAVKYEEWGFRDDEETNKICYLLSFFYWSASLYAPRLRNICTARQLKKSPKQRHGNLQWVQIENRVKNWNFGKPMDHIHGCPKAEVDFIWRGVCFSHQALCWRTCSLILMAGIFSTPEPEDPAEQRPHESSWWGQQKWDDKKNFFNTK